MAVVMIVEKISTENIIRRVLRISLDRLYIAHTRRIMATVVTIKHYFHESKLHNNLQSAASRNGRNVHKKII